MGAASRRSRGKTASWTALTLFERGAAVAGRFTAEATDLSRGLRDNESGRNGRFAFISYGFGRI